MAKTTQVTVWLALDPEPFRQMSAAFIQAGESLDQLVKHLEACNRYGDDAAPGGGNNT